MSRRDILFVTLLAVTYITHSSSKALVVSLSKQRYSHCVVLVGSRNGIERDFTIELEYIAGLMED